MTASPPTGNHRPIRSFVLRQGRLSPAQAKAHAALMPVYGIPFAAAPVDLTVLFGRTAPKILEIGFGMGETTQAIAAAHPESDFIGVEVHTPGVGSLLKRIDELQLGNVRVIQHDAVEVLSRMIAAESLAGVHIFFPDPWPKKRHHKRRLIQPALVALLASRLNKSGYVHLATDWQDYAEQMLSVLSAETTLINSVDNFAPRPLYRPLTKFEARGLKLGHGVWDLVFKKK